MNRGDLNGRGNDDDDGDETKKKKKKKKKKKMIKSEDTHTQNKKRLSTHSLYPKDPP